MTEAARPTARLAVIVRNPRARGAVDAAPLRDAAAGLRAAGWRVELVDTNARAHATALARDAAAAGAEVVVACGGDGTIGEAAHALVGTDTALATIPAGTANVWAREARIPRGDPARALALLEGGRRALIDIGEATLADAPPRRFFLVCSTGVDAAVVESVEAHPRLKRLLGRASFVAIGAAKVATLRPSDAEIALDGGPPRRAALLMAVLSNTRLYGGTVPLTHAARANDGRLDVVTFEDRGPRLLRPARYVALATRVLLRRIGNPSAAPPRGGIAYRQAERIEIRPSRRLAVETDGEAIGHCTPDAPLSVRVLPRALTMVVGPGPNRVLGDT